MKRSAIALSVFVAGGAIFLLSSCGKESSATEVKISYGAQYAVSRVDPATQNIKAELFLAASNQLQATMVHEFASNKWTFTKAVSPDKPVELTNEHFPAATAESLADLVKEVWDNLDLNTTQGNRRDVPDYWGGHCAGWCAIEFCLQWWCDMWNENCVCADTGSLCWETACCGGRCGGGT